MSGSHSIPKVAIFISTALKGARSTLRGIFDYAAAHGPWFCMFMEGRPGEQLLDLAKDGGADGVIVTGLTRPGASDIAAFHAPVVFVEPWPDMIAPDFPLQGVPWVGRDSCAIGEMAARYYLERGYTSFAFVGEPLGHYWNAERRRGELLKKPKDAYAYWLKANAQLQAMGIYPLALPDALRSYQMSFDIDE